MGGFGGFLWYRVGGQLAGEGARVRAPYFARFCRTAAGPQGPGGGLAFLCFPCPWGPARRRGSPGRLPSDRLQLCPLLFSQQAGQVHLFTSGRCYVHLYRPMMQQPAHPGQRFASSQIPALCR